MNEPFCKSATKGSLLAHTQPLVEGGTLLLVFVTTITVSIAETRLRLAWAACCWMVLKMSNFHVSPPWCFTVTALLLSGGCAAFMEACCAFFEIDHGMILRCSSTAGGFAVAVVLRAVDALPFPKVVEPWNAIPAVTNLKQELVGLHGQTGMKALKNLARVTSCLFELMDDDRSGFLDRRECNKIQSLLKIQCPMWDADLFDYDSNGCRRLSKDDVNKFLWTSFKGFGKRQFLAQMTLAVEILKNSWNKSCEDEFFDLRSTSCQDLGSICGCVIPLTEERGMRRSQLRALCKHVHRRCTAETWTEKPRGNQMKEKALSPEQVCLYHLKDYVIMPATEPRRCSYVEFITDRTQPPKWFVSHWWGEPLVDFVACLEQHSKDRQLADADAYWICAYANNQWDLKSDNFEDPAHSSFRRAMALSEGTVSILDRDAVCYSRIWCCYEVWVAMTPPDTTTTRNSGVGMSSASSLRAKKRDKQYLYDMYTAMNSATLADIAAAAPPGPKGGQGVNRARQTRVAPIKRAIGITDGCAKVDEKAQFPIDAKTKREQDFPMNLVRRALNIRLQDAFATEPSDRRRILNSIAGKKLEAQPAADHPCYDKLNNNLHGRIAAASWRRAIASGENMDLFLRALRNSQLPKFELVCDSCEVIRDRHVDDLASTFSDQLQAVNLDFSFCPKLSDVSLKSLGMGLLATNTLRQLTLTFTQCPIADQGLVDLSGCLAQMPGLRSVSLNFYGCKEITDEGFVALLMGLPKKLKQLTLDFSFNYQVTDKALHELEMSQLINLQELTLNLHYCSAALNEQGITYIANALGKLSQSLRKLELDFRFGDLTDKMIATLAKSMPSALEHVNLDFSGNKSLTDEALVYISETIPRKLDVLELQFRRCTNLTDTAMDALARHIPKSLTWLELKLTSCDQITANGIAALAKSLPSALKHLTLWLDYCSCVEEAREIIQNMFPAQNTEVTVFGALMKHRSNRNSLVGDGAT